MFKLNVIAAINHFIKIQYFAFVNFMHVKLNQYGIKLTSPFYIMPVINITHLYVLYILFWTFQVENGYLLNLPV